jgi:hypothetical protein
VQLSNRATAPADSQDFGPFLDGVLPQKPSRGEMLRNRTRHCAVADTLQLTLLKPFPSERTRAYPVST